METTSQEQKAQVFSRLRRAILLARLKVTLDKELNRPTSDTVKRLAGMKLPPLMTIATSQDRKAQLFDTLRREILAAQLKVTLDKELNRPTSDTVKRLAGMKLPPIKSTRAPQ